MIDTSLTDRPVPHRGRSRGIPPALEAFECATTPVIRLAERAMEELFGEHKILVAGQDAANFVLTYHVAALHEISFGYVDYRVRVQLRDVWVDDYVVFMATNGRGEFQFSGQSYESSTVRAFIANPGSRLDLVFDADSPHLFVRFSAALLERLLVRTLARSLREPVRFLGAFDLSVQNAWRWHAAVQLLHEELYSQDDLTRNDLRVSTLEEYLAASLLLLQCSNYHDQLRLPFCRERGSRTLRLATRFVDDNLQEDLSLEKVATAIGVSPRTLQKAFQDELHTSPMTYLRDQRLDRIRAEILKESDMAETLGTIAARWGMHHYGRFARSYRERFGESPSATLERNG
ncbi:AraC family transcriptional regulator [Ferrimicrobium sp.]|nr:AraC family transcriptional regulator [Ferrimicrobium sp.]